MKMSAKPILILSAVLLLVVVVLLFKGGFFSTISGNCMDWTVVPGSECTVDADCLKLAGDAAISADTQLRCIASHCQVKFIECGVQVTP